MAVSSDCFVAVLAVAAERRLDRAGARARAAADERQVLALQLVLADELLEPAMRLGRARDHEQARGVAVEPVDDPRPVDLVPARRVVGEQAVDERAGRMAGRRMDHEPGRLVDDEQVLVLVGDHE